MDDADLAAAAEARLEQVYRAAAPKLWRALVAYSGDPEVASDAVAEAFAQALGRGNDIRDPERWVWRAAFRIASGELKARRGRDHDIPDRSYEMPDDVSGMTEALSHLSVNQRASVVLHYYVDMPTAEIARVLGMSSATVRVHLSKGRKRLREILEASDV